MGLLRARGRVSWPMVSVGEAVHWQGGSGDDVGQPSMVTVGMGVDDELAVGTGLVEDEAVSAEDEVALVLAETAAVGKGGAGGPMAVVPMPQM